MKLRELLEIDQERIKRSEDIKVIHEWTNVIQYDRKSLASKIWGFLTWSPKIINKLLRFRVVNKKSGSEYVVYLEISPKRSFNKILSSRVKVFCKCDDFKYRAAYILNQDKNLFRAPVIDKHLGIALTEKPRVVKTTTMCKHIYAVIDYVKDNLNKLDLITE